MGDHDHGPAESGGNGSAISVLGRKDFLTKAAVLSASLAALGIVRSVSAGAFRAHAGPGATGPVLLKPGPFPNTDEAKMAHLLRRAGFGASRQELDFYLNLGLQGAVDYLLAYDLIDDSEILAKLDEYFAPPADGSQPRNQNDLSQLAGQQRWWLLRMVYTKRPLQEKMTFFWHGLLTSGFSRVGQGPFMIEQNELLRKHALGQYDALLKAISRDYAMIIWLDSRNNVKGRPNENYARELMELFSLGVGNYTEQDVREAARAFTGWTVSGGLFSFNARQHDDGIKRFLGRQGNFNGDDVIDIIVQQKACHEYIVRRLFRFFAYDNPEPEVISRLTDTFRTSNLSIRAVMRELLLSPEFYSDKAYRAKVKSPVEYVVGSIRSLSLPTDGTNLGALTTAMGQTLFNPPNVAGWPGGTAWVNSSALLQRINYAHRITQQMRREMPRLLSAIPGASGPAARSRAMDFFMHVLLDGNLPRQFSDELTRYMNTLQGARLDGDAVTDALYLMFASPEFQLA